ncbi:MAG: hypothetical protein OXI05_01480 [Bacteroidota bacterium]|nr:hypothetical protein [Bacteroidota bacterium]MDE2644499.1 hypothetical protein [Bacteroidota bacterium]
MAKKADVEKFVTRIPRLTNDDQRMIDRDDFLEEVFLKQVDLARDYFTQFHVPSSYPEG